MSMKSRLCSVKVFQYEINASTTRISMIREMIAWREFHTDEVDCKDTVTRGVRHTDGAEQGDCVRWKVTHTHGVERVDPTQKRRGF